MQARCFRCDDPGSVVFTREPYALMRCGRCRMCFVTPHPDDDARVAFYDDEGYFDEIYTEAPFARFLRDRWETSRLAHAEPWRRTGARMLEIGCGRGTFLERAVAAGWIAEGVEVSPGASKAAAQRAGVHVHNGSLESAAFGDHSFEVVAGWDVIEHVPDPGMFLREIRRVLKPGGGLLLSCPNIATWPPKLFKGRWWTLKPAEHLWHFAPDTLHGALADAGFAVRRCLTSPLRNENLARFDSMVVVAVEPVVA